jgi:hypothetical protein
MTQGNQTTPFNVDELREHLRKMSDAELRAFGQAAQHVVSPKTNPGQPPPGAFVIQLDEARKEWKRRKASQNDKAERNINDFSVGRPVKVNMHRGRIVDGTVRAVVNHTDGPRRQVDFGNDETALIYSWQVVKTISANATTRKFR